MVLMVHEGVCVLSYDNTCMSSVLQLADVVRLLSCCSCYVFRQYFAVKRVK